MSEHSRRGFLGMLGGLLAGTLAAKVVKIETPLPELFQAIPKLPLPPVEHYFVPLEVVAGKTLEILERELKWLRLKSVDPDSYCNAFRLGDSTFIREPMYFTPTHYPPDPREIVSRQRIVNIDRFAGVDMDLDENEFRGMSLNQYSERLIEPMAHGLVEHVIQGIRAAGGGEYLVMPKLQIPTCGHQRSVVMKSHDNGMSLRAMEYVDINEKYPRPKLRIDTLYGVG